MSRADSSTYTRGSPMYRTTATAITPQPDVTQILLDSGDTLAWGDGSPGTADTVLVRDAANTPALRNGTNIQALRIYETFTDASNYSRINIGDSSAGYFLIQPEAAGTGTARDLRIAAASGKVGILQVAGSAIWQWTSTAFEPITNGTPSIGSAGFGIKGLYVDYTNTGTVGAVTINKATGRVNIAATGTSVVVTNDKVTAASHVMAWMSSADGTAGVTSVVPAAGSFTITCAAVTGQTSFDFFVINTD
mgnify:CR=1 FL=1